MKKFFPLLIVVCLITAGCPAIPALLSPSASGGQPQQLQTSTIVHLYGQNYRIIKTNVTGSSWGFSLLGIITLRSPNYIKAVKQLYKEAGITEGRALAIANVAQQDTAPYFILFSIPRITLRADVVEFTGPAPVVPPVPTSPVAPVAPQGTTVPSIQQYPAGSTVH